MEEDILFVDTEKSERLQIQRPPIREAPVQFDGQSTGGIVRVRQNAGDDFGALNVVERKARGEKQIVLELIGRISTSPIVVPLAEQAEVGRGAEYGIERVFDAGKNAA